MSISVNLDLLLVKRKMTLTELSAQVGISLANLSILKTGKARAIRFTTLAALCRALNCQPGDLLEFNATTHDASPAKNDAIADSNADTLTNSQQK